MHLRLLRIVRLPLVCLGLLLGVAPVASAQVTIYEQFDEPVHQSPVNPTFTVAGFAYDTANSLPLGDWLIVVYARSTVTGTFNQSPAVLVTIVP
jgi:hypothetical protein